MSSNNSTSPFLMDAIKSTGRFATESCLAAVAITCNLFALIAAKNARGRHGAYHMLFMNLAIANSLSCVLLLTCNHNVSNYQLEKVLGDQCRIIVFVSSLAIFSSSFTLVAAATLLGFSVIQYLAVAQPLHHQNLVRRSRVCTFIACSWLITLIGSLAPVFVLVDLVYNSQCQYLEVVRTSSKVIRISANANAGVLAAIYASIIVLCCTVYSVIKRLQKRLSHFRRDQQAEDVSGERKAFHTIILLVGSLTVCFLPFTIVYLLTLNVDNSGSLTENTAIVYFMNFLPYVKFTLDPFIYGMRMKEVKESCERMLLLCGLHKFCPCCIRPTTVAIPLQTTVLCTTAL
ncbi:unnamed protein product [Dimorphilus gyrociliatus]|uniref:G-protein coupled receptors family 1 profile domain-containing protein n=1 Tax=Dimorphilus gyrociliatus TaxID=2664684 RepID=A0A7I8W583_9ANNE|nr:unnamed protein product [Dimorphilus gyrociliatus]